MSRLIFLGFLALLFYMLGYLDGWQTHKSNTDKKSSVQSIGKRMGFFRRWIIRISGRVMLGSWFDADETIKFIERGGTYDNA
jgi:hypothetical protein